MRWAWSILLGAAVGITGCSKQPQINSEYGKLRGTSVNGTGVLAQMFRQAGHRVSGWRRMSPKLEREDVIVWIPASDGLPTDAQLDYLNNWLSDGARTLIYIAGQYDASIHYWKALVDEAGADQIIEMKRQLAKVRSQRFALGARDSEARSCRWFKLNPTVGDFGDLSGPWVRNLDADAVQIESKFSIDAELDHSPIECEELLYSGEDDFAIKLTRDYWYDSQVIVMANGSALLNLMLVNHEHRKMAASLIAQCPPNSRVTFLESDDYGPTISETDASLPIMFRAFTIWPMNFLILHLTVLGILFCLSVFPIFGRPHRLEAKSTADFGKHVAAVGEMLQISQGRTYVAKALQHYRENSK